MSVPFGSQSAVPPSTLTGEPGARTNLRLILALVAAGLGLVVYACSFSDQAGIGLSSVAGTVILPLLLGGGLLAGASALPKAPNTMLPAAVLTALGALILLLAVIKNPGTTPTIVLVILVASVLQLAASVAALLVDLGLVSSARTAQAYPGGAAAGWGPPSGPLPAYGRGPVGGAYGGQYGQYGAPPLAGQPQGGPPRYGQVGSPGPVPSGPPPGPQSVPAGGPPHFGPAQTGAGQGAFGPGGASSGQGGYGQGGPGQSSSGPGAPGSNSAGEGASGYGEQRPAPQYGRPPYDPGPYGGSQGNTPGGF